MQVQKKMMKCSSQVLVAGLFLGVSSCMKQVPIDEYEFVVMNLRESTAHEIRGELEARGYSVSLAAWEAKTVVAGESIKDYQYTLTGSYLTTRDIESTTNRLVNSRRDDPVVLRRSAVSQKFESASGAVRAIVKVAVDVSPNASAYFKKNGNPVSIVQDSAGTSQYFEYQRARNEEYVDIYFLPTGSPVGTHPKAYTRIYLYEPFESKVLPWETWWDRFMMKLKQGKN